MDTPSKSLIPIQVWHATASPGHPGPIELQCGRYLDEEEHARADRFRQSTSRNQHVIGRGMARKLLSDESGIDPQLIQFGIENHGKPFVCDPLDAVLPFNVAHTHGLVVCGLSSHADLQLGVDVENVNRRTDPAIAERFFSRPEVEFLRTVVGEESKRQAFLRIWTLKESFIKAIGTGMATPLADFAFERIDSPQPTIRMLSDGLDRGHQWRFNVFAPKPGYIAATAVCTGKSTQPPDLQINCYDELVSSACDQ